MASLVNYYGMQVLDTAAQDGGKAISDDFKRAADWHPRSVWNKIVDPTASDDGTNTSVTDSNFQVGSLWLNTSTQKLFLCTDSMPGHAKWQLLPFKMLKDTDGVNNPKLVANLDANTFTISNGSFIGDGSGLTNLNGSAIASGTISGALVGTGINASSITTGTLSTARLGNQSANQVLAGPTSGSAAAPTFRALALADLPTGIAFTGSANTFTAQNTFASGTITTSQPLTITQTWNSSGTVFTAIKENITNTASAAGSLLIDLQVGGTSKFSIDKAGVAHFTNQVQVVESGVSFNNVALGYTNYSSIAQTSRGHLIVDQNLASDTQDDVMSDPGAHKIRMQFGVHYGGTKPIWSVGMNQDGSSFSRFSVTQQSDLSFGSGGNDMLFQIAGTGSNDAVLEGWAVRQLDISTGSGDIVFTPGRSEQMRVTTDGEIGLAAGTARYLRVLDQNFGTDADGDDLYIVAGNGDSTANGGNLRLRGGNNSDNTSSVTGSVFIETQLGSNNGTIGSIYLQTAVSPGDASGGDVLIDGSGNVNGTGNVLLASTRGLVGIGTSTPSATLHVVGTAVVSGSFASGVVALTPGATLDTDASQGNLFTVTLGGNWTMANPTNPTDGQKIVYRLKQDATGSRTVTWGTAFRFPGGVAPTLTTAASKTDYIGFIYNATDSKWDQVAERMNF